MEFTLDKRRLRSYGWDYVVAATAAAFPWLFCAAYFVAALQTNWKEALLLGRFAAPTSAGVLFAMLAAAGLGTTWLFRKARVLAILTHPAQERVLLNNRSRDEVRHIGPLV